MSKETLYKYIDGRIDRLKWHLDRKDIPREEFKMSQVLLEEYLFLKKVRDGQC